MQAASGMTRLPHEIALHVFPGELFIYDDRSLLVTDRDGNITGGMCGLYEHDMRLLSCYRLLVHGEPPRLDALSAVDHFSSLAYYVAAHTSIDSATRSGSTLAFTARTPAASASARDNCRRSAGWHSRSRTARSGDAADAALLVVLCWGRRARVCRPRVNRLCVPCGMTNPSKSFYPPKI